MKRGYIFKTVNNLDDKVYIGKKVSNIFDDAYRGEEKKIKEALKKYGEENFETELLEWCQDETTLETKWKYWIEKYDSINNGYNEKFKVTISFQLSEDLVDLLKEEADEEECTLSYLIRNIIKKYYKEKE